MGLICHPRFAQACFGVVVDGGAEAAREQPVAASLARLALAARGRQARVVGGAEEGMSGGAAEGTRVMVALSKNDFAATGAKSICSSANDDARFASSVSTS